MGAQAVELSASERAYLQQRGPTRFCVDPDWFPFEVIDPEGQHAGIGADLLTLVAKRAGVPMELLRTQDWPQSLSASKAGRCEVLSLLNQTPERDGWLIFTQPILTDENVIITREEHPFVGDLASLQNQTMVLPKGTSMEERVRRDFPNISIVVTDTEAQAMAMVSERKADMTLRSLIVAAYTIKREGWFNLKIAGQVPGYGNQLRIGVLKSNGMLRDILNKGASSISPIERQQIVDKHIVINATTATDYGPIRQLVGVFFLVMITSAFWMRKLNRARRDAESAAAQQQKFIAMLSHEVRTPLAVIDSSAQVLLQRLPRDSEHIPPVRRVRRGAAGLSYLIDNCLISDRINDPFFTVQKEPLDVAQMVTWVVENVLLLSPERTIDQHIEPNLPPVLGDQTLLRILLTNLLSNALKYSPAGTPVRLRAWRCGDVCALAVEDYGPGIPAEERSSIFQKYQRGGAAHGKPGVGLGLNVVKRIAELHGSGVMVQSQANLGTTFRVEIAFATAQMQEGDMDRGTADRSGQLRKLVRRTLRTHSPLQLLAHARLATRRTGLCVFGVADIHQRQQGGQRVDQAQQQRCTQFQTHRPFFNRHRRLGKAAANVQR
jgi:signal transduction histidine kinase